MRRRSVRWMQQQLSSRHLADNKHFARNLFYFNILQRHPYRNPHIQINLHAKYPTPPGEGGSHSLQIELPLNQLDRLSKARSATVLICLIATNGLRHRVRGAAKQLVDTTRTHENDPAEQILSRRLPVFHDVNAAFRDSQVTESVPKYPSNARKTHVD